MGKSLVIVESPAKSETINKLLGPEYIVKASLGHVKDLPKNELGVDVDDGFQPRYITIRGRGKILRELKNLAKRSEYVYLAPDPDREGEAISWHIANELDVESRRIRRVIFNEITKRAVLEAMRVSRSIDLAKVNAQQARRILDRLVGYKISPLLWKKVRRGLSAGRVQSVALRLVCERERDIQSFVPQEYWSITATLKGESASSFEAKLLEIAGEKAEIKNGVEAERILAELKEARYIVKSILRREQKRNPVPPFTTSKLQQEAARKLRFPARKTMLVAQQLYEGLDLGKEERVGLITYMRTDSTRVAAEAQNEAREFIARRFGSEYIPPEPFQYKNKKLSQDAHEAIRPTSVYREPERIGSYLTEDQYKLYKLIWERFLASQMVPAIFDVTTVDIEAGRYLFRATGSILKFRGFMALYIEGSDSEEREEEGGFLPELKENEILILEKLTPKQHFTQPPPRYSDATLVKVLEERGIGRPSTYAPIIQTIESRGYVERREGKFHPTDLGMIVTDLLKENFPDIVDVSFTANMEEELDKIEEGELNWVDALKEFYDPFTKVVEEAEEKMRDIKSEVEIVTDILCDKCGRNMVVKWGRHGKFLACPGYPNCNNTKPLEEREDGRIEVKEEILPICEKCGSPMVVKVGRYGKFLACSRYPDCKNTKSLGLGIPCPREGCKGELVERRTKRGRVFYGCSNYPECDFATWQRPVLKSCPRCGAKFLVEVEKKNRDKSTSLICINQGCNYKSEGESTDV